MKTYLLLLRGINVGGKNKIPMSVLKEQLVDLGFSNIRTFIASGNVILQSAKEQGEVRSLVEQMLPAQFALDSELVKVLVLDREQLTSVIADKPEGFGDDPLKYRYDILFLIDAIPEDAKKQIRLREGVDRIWIGKSVIYFQRLDAERAKSRLNSIVGMPIYKSLTIRNWNTTTKLLALMSET